jgi:acetyltransferase-like isoleucine patch superfamily enzyme
MMGPFDPETDPKLRNQILTYFMTNIMTDTERAKVLGLPEGCRVREGAKILNIENFKCGQHVWIGEGAILDAQGGLTIGSYTQIGLNVMVWSHTSHWQALQGQTGTGRKNISYKATKIGECCFIGGPSVIMPGVTIGNKVLVAPMSAIEHDLSDGTISTGTNRTISQLQERVALLEKRLAEIAETKK